MSSSMKTSLAGSRVEKDVENAYRAEISRLRPDAKWSSPYGTDGYAKWPSVRLLLEAKYDKDLKSRPAVCGVLGQLLLYVKRFEEAGEALPNVLLVGDRNECFVLSTDSVKGFLSLPIDWTVAPSTGSPGLTRALVDGVNILPYVHDVDDSFDFKEILAKIETLASGQQVSVRASVANLGAIFLYWRDRVFREGKGKQALTPVEQVDVFLRCLFHPGDVYLHPTKRGVLIVPEYPDGVLVDPDQYGSFYDHFQQGYKPSEIESFMAMRDRLIEDDARRRQGAFYTPGLWVAEAHEEIARVLGPDWRKECVVWDCAAGTANLTRDHHDWGCLISSTAERPDVIAMRDHGWGGRKDHVFHYDFLNPESESPFFLPDDGANVIPPEVDKTLREQAAAGKRLVWFMNPPYGTAGNAGVNGTSKAGIAKTVVNGEMKADGLGSPSQQLYAQFMYQCRKVAEQYGFKDYTVALFSPGKFMSSGSYRKFRHWWYDAHQYEGGFMFQASHFADVSGRWGVSFTVWNSGGKTDPKQDQPIRLTDERNFAVVTDGIKHVYNSDGREASKWVREPVKGMRKADFPQLKSGLSLRADGGIATGLEGHLLYARSSANNVMESGTQTSMVSGLYAAAHGFSVLPSNWRRAVALYGARKLVSGDWINDKDEYLAPDEAAPGYDQWVNDCHAYAVLHTSNNCTAMRDVDYKDKVWQIRNHWFWRTRAESLAALDDPKSPQTYRDCKQASAHPEYVKESNVNLITGEDETSAWDQTGDPYFAHLLTSTGDVTLSPDAQRVMDLLDALWVKSIPYRESYYAGRPVTAKQPDLHLTAWDAGVYQLKHLWRDLFPDKWAELKEAHNALADRLRDGVYTYGFLRR